MLPVSYNDKFYFLLYNLENLPDDTNLIRSKVHLIEFFLSFNKNKIGIYRLKILNIF